MPRRRVAVALLPPAELARSVQTLRRALADPRLDVLPPHLTLVPPINLTDDAFAEGRALLRSVASSSEPFELEVGPASTFAPVTPTVHLELGGDTGPLHALRARLRSGPFERPDGRPFHPHVTLREELLEPPPALAAEVLAGRLGPWLVDRVQLLEQRRDAADRRCWVPVAEEPFGPAAVVGRGGVELALRATTLVPEEAAALLDGPMPPGDPFGDALVVTAARPGSHPCDTPLGVAVGTAPAGPSVVTAGHGPHVAVVHGVVVERSERGLGIGRHLLRRWCHEAARRGAHVAMSSASSDDATRQLLDSDGFVPVGTTRVRQFVSD